MSGLKNLDIKFKYRSDLDTIYRDFYEKCLRCSIKYDRAVGYFTSDSLKLIARELENFIDRNGEIRIVANPQLKKEDIDAIEKGYKAKHDVITAALLDTIEVTTKNLEDETLNVIAWLIYKNILKIKIAYSKNNCIYHEKFGIFYDDFGDKVVFSGSANETIGGLVNNFEKIDVYFEDHEKTRIDDAVTDFNNLWDNCTAGLEIIDIPKAVRNEILTYKKESIKSTKKEKKKISPREYQLQALNNFKNNNWNGILEMATGTGKTITSLLIANSYQQESGRIFLIILVPFTHLVEQWEDNAAMFNYINILKCYDLKKSWVSKLENRVRDFNIGITTVEVVISTYKTSSSQEFNDIISNIRGKSFIIADECHYFGIKSLRNNKFERIDAKLGLSATPDRWWDEGGTTYLREYFGDTVYEYSLEEAIRLGVLTEYKYTPIVSDLKTEEIREYEKLTKKLFN
ncbi:type III restriction enzyme, res subunit [Clostridium saccharobutylicum]|uniref:DEAD/DEAH box helicase family protein n=1 Tax=Clostridium saccharobutylicum TaxID=169679 RepID=UPI000983D9E6|nr:DEAD/DEAH box helicase family protein [Clostridium saccharobutylicum]AQS09895.1 type III restriction enzyme, res subunit [Clostridium saccharobutylicum]